ncbi:hypothetical protein P152DRAFT_234840 [Eremomyces bilateralis CBS 781.70]|uniref:Uncharacterized protein n=1 Tax=Eremomyces bilateralis CBS 781.70 TaxID=1392243 RepID=A0A6G1G9S6_9PEZI|nr:uncharacterized protein P152DRAFT_234840 [Eremomyces bilateralis CBS 781.70]KAF1814835.1 hypothetical protein P152DRAFT_234840 [Eremomyces bilateralis CBS 781.70]
MVMRGVWWSVRCTDGSSGPVNVVCSSGHALRTFFPGTIPSESQCCDVHDAAMSASRSQSSVRNRINAIKSREPGEIGGGANGDRTLRNKEDGRWVTMARMGGISWNSCAIIDPMRFHGTFFTRQLTTQLIRQLDKEAERHPDRDRLFRGYYWRFIPP